MKVDIRSRALECAHSLYKENGGQIEFSECLRVAWKYVKSIY